MIFNDKFSTVCLFFTRNTNVWNHSVNLYEVCWGRKRERKRERAWCMVKIKVKWKAQSLLFHHFHFLSQPFNGLLPIAVATIKAWAQAKSTGHEIFATAKTVGHFHAVNDKILKLNFPNRPRTLTSSQWTGDSPWVVRLHLSAADRESEPEQRLGTMCCRDASDRRWRPCWDKGGACTPPRTPSSVELSLRERERERERRG